MRRERLGPTRDDVDGARCFPYAGVIRRDCPVEEKGRTRSIHQLTLGCFHFRFLFKTGREMDTANQVSENQKTQFQ